MWNVIFVCALRFSDRCREVHVKFLCTGSESQKHITKNKLGISYGDTRQNFTLFYEETWHRTCAVECGNTSLTAS